MAHDARKPRMKPSDNDLGIYSSTEFQAILRYERARADRASSTFSLVMVDSQLHLGNKNDALHLVRALRQRIRTTDVIGWLDDATLSVLLPGTDLNGARIFAGNFQKQYSTDRPLIPVTVYCYPDHWLQGNNKSSPGKHDTDEGGSPGFSRVQQIIVETTLSRRIPLYKSILDIIVSLAALIFSSPLFLILAGYITIVSRGPVFYKQKRIGYRGLPFTFLKFRTMHTNNDPRFHQVHVKDLINSDRPMEKLDVNNDPRIIPGGRIIRKTCIDELPQLFNVLKGQMSLVGPRPCMPYEAEEYLRWHSYRFDVKPGLTGLWQVSGKNKLTFKQMIRLDISYCQNMSLWLDVKIIFRTFPTIVSLALEGLKNRINRTIRKPLASSTSQHAETSPVPTTLAEHI